MRVEQNGSARHTAADRYPAGTKLPVRARPRSPPPPADTRPPDQLASAKTSFATLKPLSPAGIPRYTATCRKDSLDFILCEAVLDAYTDVTGQFFGSISGCCEHAKVEKAAATAVEARSRPEWRPNRIRSQELLHRSVKMIGRSKGAVDRFSSDHFATNPGPSQTVHSFRLLL